MGIDRADIEGLSAIVIFLTENGGKAEEKQEEEPGEETKHLPQ